MTPLSPAELERALKNLPEWKHEDGALVTTFAFDDFLSAIDFVGAVAEVAEKRQHHPLIIIDYTHVTLEVTTHDAGHKVTDKDVALAHAIEDLQFDYDAEPEYTGI